MLEYLRPLTKHGEVFKVDTSHKEAEIYLDTFIKERLEHFGDYEDAIAPHVSHGNHSELSPYLNIGLLTPEQVIDAVLFAYKKGSVSLNNVEGFIRQVIGWREFMRALYEDYGTVMRKRNFFNHTKAIDRLFWDGNTGNVVIDTTLSKVFKRAYAHHIERLMILGNYMLLAEYNPDEVYEWFMTFFIDAYDWVMVPNVYGMSQYADGGIFATKPYICASNYIIKMSTYKKDGIWDTWFDDAFWTFIRKHKDIFSKNPRFKMLLSAKRKTT
jgi:deoxyribodipyrimidine photolyase-related protein